MSDAAAGFDRRIRHLPFLDGLRAIAVLMVIGVHFPYMTGVPGSKTLWSFDQAIRGGFIGVDLFFVLSGFLITRILLRQRMQKGRFSFRVFYGRRALRIFPIYYASILFCAAMFPMTWPEAGSLIVYGFNYYQPLHALPHPMEHTWSLAVEEQFYIAWPIVLAVVPLRWGRAITGIAVPLLAVAAAITFASLFQGQLASDLIYMSTPTRMMSLSAGAFIAFCEQQNWPVPRWACLSSLAAGVCLLGADQLLRKAGWVAAAGPYWVIATAGYALASSGVIATLVFGYGAIVQAARAVLTLRPLRYVGRISYGLYLYHLIVLYSLGLNDAARGGADGAPALRVLEAALLTTACAMLSYHLVEQRLLRLKDRLREGPDGIVAFGKGRQAQAADG